jgi:hypothetical protein
MVLVLLICFFIFFYTVYYLSHDDFVLVRKDIPIGAVFSLTFLMTLFSLFLSRLFFVLSYSSGEFLNLLGFLDFNSFPGLSLIGAIAGSEIFIYLYCDYKKMPAGRIFDLFSLSFIGVLPIGFLLNLIIHLGRVGVFDNIILVFSIFLVLLFAKVIYPFSVKGEIKDGSLGFMFVAIFSCIYFLTKLFLDLKNFSFLNLENILILITLFSSLMLLLKQEIMDRFLAKK